MSYNSLDVVVFWRLLEYQDQVTILGWHIRILQQGVVSQLSLIHFIDRSLVTCIPKLFLSSLACAWIRYGFLLDTKLSQDPLSTSDSIMKQFNLPPEMYQVGYRKIYLRTGQVSFFITWRCYVWFHDLSTTVTLSSLYFNRLAYLRKEENMFCAVYLVYRSIFVVINLVNTSAIWRMQLW